jgi:ankyrin repeat protein
VKVAELLGNGADPDVVDLQGFRPLHLAAQQGSLEAVRTLLDGGATVDVANSIGNTPLSVAVFNSRGRDELIELLRSRGADPLHLNNSQQSPVALARLIGNFDVARFFVDLPD